MKKNSISKGRISINGTKYLLTNITKTEDTWGATIREIPDFPACKEQNISAEDCEISATQVGEVSVTKRVTTEPVIKSDERRVGKCICRTNSFQYSNRKRYSF